jgi:hypothetical protein
MCEVVGSRKRRDATTDMEAIMMEKTKVCVRRLGREILGLELGYLQRRVMGPTLCLRARCSR